MPPRRRLAMVAMTNDHVHEVLAPAGFSALTLERNIEGAGGKERARNTAETPISGAGVRTHADRTRTDRARRRRTARPAGARYCANPRCRRGATGRLRGAGARALVGRGGSTKVTRRGHIAGGGPGGGAERAARTDANGARAGVSLQADACVQTPCVQMPAGVRRCALLRSRSLPLWPRSS